MKDRLITNHFPTKMISSSCIEEKKKHHGDISSLHVWFARRPLTSSIASAYASLVYDGSDERELLNSISSRPAKNDIRFQNNMKKAKKHLLSVNNGNKPRVLDPFGGGGSIPLAALSLGCDSYSNDYNPVAWLIQRCSIEWPQKYRKQGLINDIKKYSKILEGIIAKEMKKYHTANEYLWTRTIPCINPDCGIRIPLLKTFMIDNKNSEYLSPYIDKEKNRILFNIKKSKEKDNGHTYDKGMVTCPACNIMIEKNETRELLLKNTGIQMITCVYRAKTKKFRKVRTDDENRYELCGNVLKAEREEFKTTYGIDPVPEEPLSTPTGKEYEKDDVYWNYIGPVTIGVTRWSHAFNDRQTLFHVLMAKHIRRLHAEMIMNGIDGDYADCIAGYLAIIQSKLSARGQSMFSIWAPGTRRIVCGINGPKIDKVLDFGETNPTDRAGFQTKIKAVIDSVRFMNDGKPATITFGSATSLPYENDYFDGVFTDPPYYDFIQYADLSDFFYVVLKKTLSGIFPDQFGTLLTPKRREIVTNENMAVGFRQSGISKTDMKLKDKSHFKRLMSQSLSEMHRVLKSNGILTVVYAHKSTEGWEVLIESLRNVGFAIISAWPIQTEAPRSLITSNTSAISSTLQIVARKNTDGMIGNYDEIITLLQNSIDDKIKELESEPMSNTDRQTAAIGASLYHITKYQKIEDSAGEEIKIKDMLDKVYQYLANRNLNDVLDGMEFTGAAKTYIIWKTKIGSKKEKYDEVRKTLRLYGIEIESNKEFIKISKNRAEFLSPYDFNHISDIPHGGFLSTIYRAILIRKESGDSESAVNEILKSGEDLKNVEEKLLKLARITSSAAEASDFNKLAAAVKHHKNSTKHT